MEDTLKDRSLTHVASEPAFDAEREAVLRVLAAAAFLIFFQSYLVAPLIPALSREFRSSEKLVGLLVPAYVLPYGVSTLFYGPLSDRKGRRRVLLVLLAAMVLGTGGAALARTATQLLLWRVAAGTATGGIIPIGLALLGDLYPYEQRGRPLGWIFGSIAGGMAFGASLGALLNPIIGWRREFFALSVLSAIVFFLAYRHRVLLEGKRSASTPGLTEVIGIYLDLLRSRRGSRAYGFILLNGIFHAGIFSWLGLYFSRRYSLGETGIGLALMGYGIPGLLLGPVIGRAADRFGRSRIIPIGFAIAAIAAGALVLPSPVIIAATAVTILSLGFDMSHPLLAGIITSLDPARRGQAMGLNAFVLFFGFGMGSLIFQQAMAFGFTPALAAFAGFQLLAAIACARIFKDENAENAATTN